MTMLATFAFPELWDALQCCSNCTGRSAGEREPRHATQRSSGMARDLAQQTDTAFLWCNIRASLVTHESDLTALPGSLRHPLKRR
jgi:hypothetical protein